MLPSGELVGLVRVLEVGKLKLTLTSWYCRAMRKGSPVGVRQNQNSRGNVHHLGVDGDITSDGHTTETDLGTVNVGWLPMRSWQGRGQRTG
jgi:hypothetical protein